LYYVKHSLAWTDLTLLVAVYFILLKLALVVSLALLFSCATTPLLATLYTAGLYVAGLFVEQMRTLRADVVSPAVARAMKYLSYMLPNFNNFEVMGAAAHGKPIPGSLILYNTVYAVLYCGMVLTAASVIFSRRNLK
jgi:ABC-type transport system involved in multi-copper enzyme maturation permease subunit